VNEATLVSIVALGGCLILVVSAYRSHRVNMSKTIRMALIWACIFTGIAFLFSLLL
jgi:hypothetical protein